MTNLDARVTGISRQKGWVDDRPLALPSPKMVTLSLGSFSSCCSGKREKLKDQEPEKRLSKRKIQEPKKTLAKLLLFTNVYGMPAALIALRAFILSTNNTSVAFIWTVLSGSSPNSEGRNLCISTEKNGQYIKLQRKIWIQVWNVLIRSKTLVHNMVS